MLSKDPVRLTDQLLFQCRIERRNDFEAREAIGKIRKPEGDVPDYLFDDTALIYKSSQGLVIITGFSLSGICNIVEQAMNFCNEERVLDIVGMLHLLDSAPTQLKGTFEYMKNLNLRKMHPCHCKDFKSKMALSEVVNLEEVGEGLVIEYG